jgi:hypothetical protein
MVRIIGTVNLVVALLVVAGYYLYASQKGLPINRIFLGFSASHREHLSAPGMVAFLETIVFVGLLIGKLMRSPMPIHRIVCGFVGVFGLFSLFILSTRRTIDAGESHPAISHLDEVIMIYVWGSHLLYALAGPNADDDDD